MMLQIILNNPNGLEDLTGEKILENLPTMDESREARLKNMVPSMRSLFFVLLYFRSGHYPV